MNNGITLENLNEVMTEPELLELLGIKKSKLNDLRYNNHLPFCKVSRTNRIYLVGDVLDLIKSRRMILNSEQ